MQLILKSVSIHILSIYVLRCSASIMIAFQAMDKAHEDQELELIDINECPY